MFLPRWTTRNVAHAAYNIFDLARPMLREVPSGGRVLEIGCEGGEWLALAHRADPTLELVGVDWAPKKVPTADAGYTIEAGDIRVMAFAPASFDAIVALSALEHVGLGHYSEDPVDPDGDIVTVQRIQTWLKSGGWAYYDVPYTPDGFQLVRGTKCRSYDDASIGQRLGAPTVLGYTDLAGDAWREKPTRNRPDSGRPYRYVALRLDRM